MKLQLNTMERVMLAQVFDTVQGVTVGQIRKALKLAALFELNDEEKQAVGFVARPDGSAKWDDAERAFEVEFPDAEVEFVKATFAAHRWSGIPPALVVALADKLGVE